MAEKADAEFEVLDGTAALAEKATGLVTAAGREIALFSQELDRRVYGTDAFLSALRKFCLQHSHARARLLIHSPAKALHGSARLVEFGRAMSSFVEFRELPENKQALTEEYLICDGRVLLHKSDPMDLQAKLYAAAPHVARHKLREFDALWNESDPAQEIRGLRL